MPTYISPNAIIDHSITSAKLAEDISIGNSKVFYGICDTSAATVDKVVTCNSFAADDLVEGVMVSVKFNYTNSGAVASLTLAVNDTSAYPIKKIYNSGIKDLTSAGELYADAIIPFVFTGSCWLVTGVNMNTTYTMNYSYDAGSYKAGTGTYAVTRYSLILEKPDGTWEKTTSTAATYTTATTKTVNTSGFLLNRIRYYGTTAIKANGELIAANTCYSKAASVDMRYSTNCGASPGWAVGDYMYLVGTLGSDGLFYLDTTAWWSNALPSANDGKLYIRLGLVLANSNGDPTYSISFLDDRLIFYHDGTSVRIYNPGGGGVADLMTSVTYSELKALRDSSGLVPGMQYRITDYECTTAQANTQSAGHQFDVIVTADSSTVLNENARAAKRTDSSTDYFAKCSLDAWELKYSLDNDTDRFAWADTSNGKGVIYYMKDEWNNECPYDFKNILFERCKITECLKSPNLIGLYAKAGIDGITVDDEQKFMVPTFCMIDSSDGTTHDVTVEQDVYPCDDLEDDVCYSKTNNNHISGYIDLFQGDDEQYRYTIFLPNVVFVTDTEICDIEENFGTFYAFYNNSFGNSCLDNTFGNACFNNTFGNDCNNNTFGNSCSENSFGKFCGHNTFGNDCHNNSFGNSCGDNFFGSRCDSNSFGHECQSNSFGNFYYNNTFGNGCFQNSFGNNCYRNTLMNACAYNSFGNACMQNSFGNNCQNNSFGNYCQAITVFDDVRNCSVTGGTYQALVKNAQILNGTAGASNNSKLTIAFAANKAYTQIAAKTTAGTLKIYNPADLAQ